MAYPHQAPSPAGEIILLVGPHFLDGDSPDKTIAEYWVVIKKPNGSKTHHNLQMFSSSSEEWKLYQYAGTHIGMYATVLKAIAKMLDKSGHPLYDLDLSPCASLLGN